MAEVIIMPKLGYNMDEGQLVKWHVAEGSAVKKGDVLFEINTDKTTMPVEATMDGILLAVLLAEGQTVPVFTPIAVIGQAGESAQAALAAFNGASPAPSTKAAPARNAQKAAVGQEASAPAPAVDIGSLKLSPKARKLIQDEGIDVSSVSAVKGTGFQGGITARDIKASPLARKLAERAGIDLAAVSGTGRSGKVMKADVLQAGTAPASFQHPDKRVASTVPYDGIRKIIGERLSSSKFTAPHLYFTDSVDTTNLSAFRAQANAGGETKITVSDLLIMAVSKALQRYPDVNVSLVGDTIFRYASVNVGMAVAGENGLIVPVVKNLQEKNLSAIARETRDLVERAKAGRLMPDEFSGGTFTISNLGMFGIENFTAIINPPESAILAVSSVRKTPVVVAGPDGEDIIAIRPMMKIQLSVDHRVIDGLLAAQFLGYLKALLENPIRMLI